MINWLRRWFGFDEREPDDERESDADRFAREHEQRLRERNTRLQMLEADADLLARRFSKKKGEQR
jgi:hypothetical protein